MPRRCEQTADVPEDKKIIISVLFEIFDWIVKNALLLIVVNAYESLQLLTDRSSIDHGVCPGFG